MDGGEFQNKLDFPSDVKVVTGEGARIFSQPTPLISDNVKIMYKL